MLTLAMRGGKGITSATFRPVAIIVEIQVSGANEEKAERVTTIRFCRLLWPKRTQPNATREFRRGGKSVCNLS